MPKKSRKLKSVLQMFIVIAGGLALTILVIACSFTIWVFSLLAQRDAERQRNCATLDARPIPDDVMLYLCDNNLIPLSLGDCNGETLQMRDTLTIMESNITLNTSSYDDVSRIFGIYEDYCYPPLQDRPIFRCRYKIGGVWPTIYILYNSETNIIESIGVQACGGS
jgi:hypothetical protein